MNLQSIRGRCVASHRWRLGIAPASCGLASSSAFLPFASQAVVSQRSLSNSSRTLIPRHLDVQKAFPKYELGSVSRYRYASSTSTKSKLKRTSSTTTSSSSTSLLTPSSTSTKSLVGDVNPPPSTRPADLDLPEPISPSASLSAKASRYFNIGRAYVKFYKTGLKNVYHNYKAAMPIRQRIGLPMYLPTSPVPRSIAGAGGPTSTTTDRDTKAAAPPPSPTATAIRTQTPIGLSRADFQLIRRAAYDVRRMIPFTLILIICGEFTPLVVLALGTAVTPFTCRVPGQIAKERRWRLEMKRSAFGAIQASLGSVDPVPVGSEQELQWLAENYADPEFVNNASADQVLRGCALFGLTKSIDRPRWLVPLIYRPRLKRWVEYLRMDDELLARSTSSSSSGGVKGLSAEEVRTAVDERGGVGVGTDVGRGEQDRQGWEVEREERRWLEKWLKRREPLITGSKKKA